MKIKLTVKAAALIAAACFSSAMHAQTLKENFDNVARPKIPTGWIQWNVDGRTPNNDISVLAMNKNAWVSFTFDGNNNYMVSTSHYTPEGKSDDWLVTPAVMPKNGEYLSWDAASLDQSRKEAYEVRISTTDSLPASFTKVLFSSTGENPQFTTRLVDLSAYAGQRIYVAFRDISDSKYILLLDNVMISPIPKANAGLSGISPGVGSMKGYAMKGTNAAVSVDVINLGVDTIKSGTIRYTDGTNTYTTAMSTSIGYNQAKTFTLPAYLVKTLDVTNLKAWVEVSNDLIHNNDTMRTTITGTTFWPKHRVTFEEGTGTWCGWCPRGAVFLDSIGKKKGDDAVLIAVHNGDPMTVTAYDGSLGKYIAGYPMAVTERKVSDDPSNMFNNFDDLVGDCGIAELKITSLTRGTTMTVNVSAKSAINSVKAGDWRLALVITEDQVRGTTTQYDQHNYYSGSAVNILKGAGHDWNKEANPIPAAKMTYNHVARYISDFNGTDGTLPDMLEADSTYHYSFSLNKPASIGHDFLCVANVLLINQTTGQIVNAVSARFTPLSVNEIVKQSIQVYPNPATQVCHVELEQANIQKLFLTDLLGNRIEVPYTYDGETLSIDMNSLSNGVYMLSIQTDNSLLTSKIIKE